MDLVACYDSDESGADKSKTPTKFQEAAKEVDIIEIDDSDTDTELDKTLEVQATKSSDDNQQKNSKTSDSVTPVTQIECIDIDSDCEDEIILNTQGTKRKEDEIILNTQGTKRNEDEIILNTSLTNSKENTEADKLNSKKVDYLNLEGNDSEEEQQAAEANVNDLLSSAAVLNNVTCGPEKNVFINQSPDDISTHRNKSEYESQTPNSSISCNFDFSSPNDKKISKCENMPGVNEKSTILADSIINKRFKREASTPIAACTDLSEAEDCGLSSYMYRKDERITGAFAKSVACRLPRQITRHLISHVNSVTALQWCIPQYSHLLLSASADSTVKIWDMYCKNPIQTVKDNLGLKAAKWSLSGEQIIIGGYGKKAKVFDVLSGKEIISYDIFNYVHSIEIHPYIEDIFLVGTRNAIFGFDLRVNSTLPIRTYLSKCEEVLDIAFLDENEFICSTNVVSHDSADRTIMVWDFSSGAVMSNQIFLERYTCPSLKVHPHDSSFIAQTNGDYIATFSSLKPYKIKDKRYMGHKVSGFGVECDISPDGKYIASGDANGDVYFYNYSNTNIITKLKVRPNMATNRLKWHPALNSTLATATWDGHIQIWK